MLSFRLTGDVMSTIKGKTSYVQGDHLNMAIGRVFMVPCKK